VSERGTNELEHLDVLIIGAGLSGIGAAHHVQSKNPWATYAVIEALDAIGGTWDLFRYPGIRSDSDMFTLGYSFRPWDGDKTIADGASIRDYIERTADAEGVRSKIRFNQRVVAASWSTPDARWTVTIEHGDGERSQLTCSFLFGCTGYYRYDRGYLPDFPGMDEYGGTLVHPQQWPEDLDVTGKRVVVIGSGATAITLIPSLAETAAHVTMLQRSPTWIASLPGRSPIAKLRRIPGRLAATVVRWAMALTTQGSYQLSRRRPEVMKRFLRKGVERSLPAGYDVDRHFTPRYDPWDQRLCVVPDGDLFKAISAGKASVVTDQIETFTERGIRVASGEELEADVIVTATGLSLLFLGGMEVRVDGEVIEPSSRITYKGMMMEGVPNLAFAFGYTNASWTLKAELTCDYVTRLLQRMHTTGLRQCTAINVDPSIEPAPFIGLTSGYVQRAVELFPKQGSRFPWQVHQSYVKDYRAMRLKGIDDDVMQFSNPAPVRTEEKVDA